jgi:hypothetical protein
MAKLRYFLEFAKLVIRNSLNIRRDEFLLWTHLGLGDQISVIPSIYFLLGRNKTIHIPVKSQNFKTIRTLFQNESNVILVEVPNDNKHEAIAIRDYANLNKIKIVTAGHGLLRGLQFLFPLLGLNGLLNKACMTKKIDLRSTEVLKSLKNFEQLKVPDAPYVLVDHHPGTWREIPNGVLDNIKEKYQVVENPRDTPLFSIVSLIQEATEIHFVTSAPLCLALVTRQNPKNCFAYCAPPLLRNDYPGWVEVRLPDSDHRNILALSNDRAFSRQMRMSGYFDRLCI